MPSILGIPYNQPLLNLSTRPKLFCQKIHQLTLPTFGLLKKVFTFSVAPIKFLGKWFINLCTFPTLKVKGDIRTFNLLQTAVFDFSRDFESFLKQALLKKPLDYQKEKNQFGLDLNRSSTTNFLFDGKSMTAEEFGQKIEEMNSHNPEFMKELYFASGQGILNGLHGITCGRLIELDPDLLLFQGADATKKIHAHFKDDRILVDTVQTNFNVVRDTATKIKKITLCARFAINRQTGVFDIKAYAFTMHPWSSLEATHPAFDPFDS
ncbi:MAG: hypothetical protein FJZ61_00440 [Chlamydiae bacterium]|nr:hypothetical protein [Chlamydiota bacterium]